MCLPVCRGWAQKRPLTSGSTSASQRASVQPLSQNDNSVPPCVSLKLSSCCPFAGAEGKCIRASECMHEPFKWIPETAAALSLIQSESLLIFTVRGCGDFSPRRWDLGLGSPVWDWDLSPLRGDLRSQHTPPDSEPPSACGGPARFASLSSYLSPHDYFFISTVIGILLIWTAGDSQGWWFYSLVVILIWSREEASTAFSYSAILTGTRVYFFFNLEFFTVILR